MTLSPYTYTHTHKTHAHLIWSCKLPCEQCETILCAIYAYTITYLCAIYARGPLCHMSIHDPICHMCRILCAIYAYTFALYTRTRSYTFVLYTHQEFCGIYAYTILCAISTCATRRKVRDLRAFRSKIYTQIYTCTWTHTHTPDSILQAAQWVTRNDPQALPFSTRHSRVVLPLLRAGAQTNRRNHSCICMHIFICEEVILHMFVYTVAKHVRIWRSHVTSYICLYIL